VRVRFGRPKSFRGRRSSVAIVVLAGLCLAVALFGLVSTAGSLSAAAARATASPAQSADTIPAAVSAEPSAAVTASPFPFIAPTPVPTPAATPYAIPTPSVVSEVRVSAGTEPSIAASPFDPDLVAVVAENVSWATSCSTQSVSVSHDAGATWSATRPPWGAKCQDMHAVLAWGPGPKAGSSRLWAANAVGVTGGVSVSITHSDNYGATWSPLYVQRFTRPWIGCFPAIAVDDSIDSPNYGTVYVAYNWLPNSLGPSISVIASHDGTHWLYKELPPVGQAGFRYKWTFGNRVAVAPDGSAYVSFYEADMRTWDAGDMFNQHGSANVGRAGFSTTHIHFGSILTADPPAWSVSLVPSPSAAFDPMSQSQLAVSPSGEIWMVVNDTDPSGGIVRLGYSSDAGAYWTWRTLTVPGMQSSKASLAISGDRIFVGWHAQDQQGAMWTYYTLSYDGGAWFLPPRPVTNATFRVPAIVNGTGLRENADFGKDRVYYAWGDNRDGLSIHVATIQP
jgi:hypothetical protein